MTSESAAGGFADDRPENGARAIVCSNFSRASAVRSLSNMQNSSEDRRIQTLIHPGFFGALQGVLEQAWSQGTPRRVIPPLPASGERAGVRGESLSPPEYAHQRLVSILILNLFTTGVWSAGIARPVLPRHNAEQEKYAQGTGECEVEVDDMSIDARRAAGRNGRRCAERCSRMTNSTHEPRRRIWRRPDSQCKN